MVLTRKTIPMLLALGCAIVLPRTSHANDHIAFSSPLTMGNQAWLGSLGLRFDVAKDIFVTKLGVFDSNAVNGSMDLASPLFAQIFDRTTHLAVSPILTFNTTTNYTLIGGDLFQSLSNPLTLSAGFKGEIVAWGFNSIQLNGNRNISTLPPTTLDTGGGAIAFTDDASDYGSYGAYPTSVFDSSTYPGHPAGTYRTGFLAGTFQFTPVPEASTLFCFGSMLGLGGFLLYRRKG